MLQQTISNAPCSPAGKVKDTFLYGPLPVWQHRLRDVFTLEEQIKKEIALSCPGVDASSAPSEPIMFSYWIISTMPFKFKQRLGHFDWSILRFFSR